MTLLSITIIVLYVLGAAVSDEDCPNGYLSPNGGCNNCPQGSIPVAQQYSCVECPENTYWRQKIFNNTIVTGSECASCPHDYKSPKGTLSILGCVCTGENCERKDKHLPVIASVIGVVVGIILIVIGLMYCRGYNDDFMQHFRKGGDDTELKDDEDQTLLAETPSPGLIDVKIDLPEEVIDDPYNDVTAKGDHNDIEAVVRAAAISEKRRSRVLSMCSASDINSQCGRYRTSSMCSRPDSVFEDSKPGPSAPPNLPLPAYPGLATTRM